MNAYHYATKYRPPGFATVPDGWELIESGFRGDFPLRTDLPRGRYPYGVIRYRRPLSPAEIEQWELIEV